MTRVILKTASVAKRSRPLQPQMQRGAAGAPLEAIPQANFATNGSVVAVARIGAQPAAVGALDVAAVMIPVIATAAAFALAGDGSPGPGADDGANRGTAATADSAADDCARGSAEQGTAKRVLGDGLMGRQRDGKAQ